MYARTAVRPFPDSSAFGAWKRHVDFHTESHQFGGLRCCPVRAIGGFHYVEYSHQAALCRSSQRCV